MRRTAFAVLLAFSPLLAQDTLRSVPPAPGNGRETRRILATSAVGAIFAGSLVSSYYDWWKESSRPFHFTDDGLFNNYALGIDKIGHAYTSYFYFQTFRSIMLWGGYGEETAFWWSAGTTLFFALSIEVGDGLSAYGFSAGDLAFNVAGLGYGMVQSRVPFLQNFKLKWSYVPRDGYRWPPKFTDHYDAHTYWVTVNLHRLLPESIGAYWPEFLQLALGYGVDERQSRREGVIGLDLNLSVFQVENPELRLLQRTIDLLHIPGPAMKFTQGKKPRYYGVVKD